MPDCCAGCEHYADVFDRKVARRDLRRYIKRGPNPTTRALIELVGSRPLGGTSLLEIGGGVGALQHELVGRGLSRVTDVDASPAYLATAREEAARRGYGERATYIRGDFVALASTVAPADVVVLDRVICCYRDMAVLVRASAGKARRWYAIAIPRDRWLVRAFWTLENLVRRLRRDPFRGYVHREAAVDERVRAHGLERIAERRTAGWAMLLYERAGPVAGT